ncbi:MAG TPA: GAF domain-containing protein [Firmicutes bacterium]|nr:GAF domain-containing protein [Bacillota bacterium]
MYSTDYERLKKDLHSLLAGETSWLANLANTAAFIFQELRGINWAGFYLLDGSELVLGPFQGKPACVRIAVGNGVCGTAAQRRQSIVVPDVHKFPGHIACDPASRSEVVVPMIAADGRLLGVLDVDSPHLERFGASDSAGLGGLVRILLSSCRWPGLPPA